MAARNKNQPDGARSFLASGVIGVKADSAGETELIQVARQWATDEGFRVLVVRHVDEENWGIHFVYLSGSPNRDKIEACLENLRETFGPDCIHRLDIASQTVAPDSAESPVIALRGMPGQP